MVWPITEPILTTVEGRSGLRGGDEHRHQIARQHEKPGDVDAHHAIEPFPGKPFERLAPGRARVVDENVQLLRAAAHLVGERGHAGLARDRAAEPFAGTDRGELPATSSQASPLREAISTRAPALSSASAQTRPSPVAPPVTSAVRPLTEKRSGSANMGVQQIGFRGNTQCFSRSEDGAQRRLRAFAARPSSAASRALLTPPCG